MFKRLNSNLITALCTGCAIIAFAFLSSPCRCVRCRARRRRRYHLHIACGVLTSLAKGLSEQDIERAMTAF